MSEKKKIEDLSKNPSAEGRIEINEVADGFIVHQPVEDKVHYLNHTAAIVLQLCDGETSIEDIAEWLRESYELPDPPSTEVNGCLLQLFEEGLIK